MSEATARTYRPKRFKDFIGQEHITSSLKNGITQSKIAHGYLFSGPRGVGKTSAARVLAKALNCFNRTQEGEPCLECQSCLDIAKGKSLDVIEIDGASHRGIDKMREIKDNLQFLPSYSHYKIYIIDEVHMLTTEAFNAILKTLEEPPRHIVFIFATTEIHKVKSTIRSRCQQYYFKRLTIKEIADHLGVILDQYQISYEKEALILIAKAADGSMRDSQSILDQAIIFSDGQITALKVKDILGLSSDDQFIEFLDILINQDAKAMIGFINQLYHSGTDLGFFTMELVNYMRYLILVKYEAYEVIDQLPLFIDKLKERERHFTVYQCHQIVQMLLNLYKDLKENSQELFFIESVFTQLLDYPQFVHLSELVKRLEALENGELEPVKIKEMKVDLVTNEQQPTPKKLEAEPTPEIKIEPIKKDPPPVADTLPITPKEVEKIPLKEVENPINSTQSTQDVVSLLWNFSKSLQNPKWQTIMADIQDVRFDAKNSTLHLEFLTYQYKDAFYIQQELKQSIIDFYKEYRLTVKEIVSFVKEADLIRPENKDKLIKDLFGGQEIDLNER